MLKRVTVDRKGFRSQRNLRPKKRQPPPRPEKMESETEYTSSSARKLKKTNTSDVSYDPSFSYCILQFTAIFLAIAECVVCRKCGGDVKFLKSSSRGLGFKLNVFCTKCDDNIKSVNSSPLINNAYEINRRFSFAMRLLGKGLKAMQLFCGIMDLSSCIWQSTFDVVMTNIEKATKAVALASVKTAAKEELQETQKQDEIKLSPNALIVSGDGTWMKRGFASLFGVATLIGNFTGKVVDFLVKSSYCKECEAHEKYRNTVEYEVWQSEHQSICSANHQGSAGKMEPDAIVEMFERSEELHQVKYEYYVGDGDSKTFSAIRNCEPYGDLLVKKKECIGHVQKRMGSRLRKILTNYKILQSQRNQSDTTKEEQWDKPSTSKIIKQESLTGKGKLTGKLIDELTIYYGLAIRNNINSTENMKSAIWATFYHKISTDDNPQHFYCPSGSDSWCTWQKAKAENSLNTYKHNPALPEIIQQAIKPVYESLSEDNLLERCLGGFTQNNNESLNSKIWRIAPKSSSGSRKIVEIAANIATASFNDGAQCYLQVLQLLGITIGYEAYNYCQSEDANRLKHARIHAHQATKQARTTRRQQKNIKNIKKQEEEGIQYEAGMSD